MKNIVITNHDQRVDNVLKPGYIISSKFYMKARCTHIVCNYILNAHESDNVKVGHRVHILIDDISFFDDNEIELYHFINKMYNITKKKVIIHVPSTESILLRQLKDMHYILDEKECWKVSSLRKEIKITFREKNYKYKEEGVSIRLIAREKPIIGIMKFGCTRYIEE